MNLDFTKFSPLLSFLYTDTFDYYTKELITNSDGTTGSKLGTVPKNNFPITCRISFEAEDNPNSLTEEANPIRLQFKIFCANDVSIKKGDKVVAYKKDGKGNTIKTYSGIANLPLVYETHQEVIIEKVGEA